MKRREFLDLSVKSGSFFLASNVLSGAIAKAFAQTVNAAGEDTERFFVQLYMDGGWDVTLGLNPWAKFDHKPDEHDYFLEYGESQLLRVGDGFVGPALEGLKDHSQDISVINGVFMSNLDNGHPANKNYIATGNGQSKTPYLSIEYEASAIKSLPLGVLTNQSVFRADRSVQTVNIATCLNIDVNLLTNKASLTPLQKLASDLSSYAPNILAAQNELQLLKTKEPDLSAQAIENVALCFKYGLSRSAFVGLTNQGRLDTHASHEGTHLKVQKAAWDDVARWFKVFKETEYKNGESLFSRTTFMVTSEFSRTPALNAAKGKDHNPYTNSVLFAGNGVRGGLSLGGSKLVTSKNSQIGMSYLVAQSMDMETGAPLSTRQESYSGYVINPEIIASTVAAMLKVDRRVFSNGYKAEVLPLVVK